jgi:hypothetical protein
VIDITTIDAKIRELKGMIRVLEAEKQEQLGKNTRVDIILGDASWTPAQREEAWTKYFASLSPEDRAKWKVYENPKPKQRVS